MRKGPGRATCPALARVGLGPHLRHGRTALRHSRRDRRRGRDFTGLSRRSLAREGPGTGPRAPGAASDRHLSGSFRDRFAPAPWRRRPRLAIVELARVGIDVPQGHLAAGRCGGVVFDGPAPELGIHVTGREPARADRCRAQCVSIGPRRRHREPRLARRFRPWPVWRRRRERRLSKAVSS